MPTILIVEDDISLAELIKDRLENKGYKILVAYTGSESTKYIDEQKPDVITLDIHLPDISGIEILKKLKKDKDKFSIPIIIVTSDDTKQLECEENKADAFVKKPIDFKKLEEIIRTVIKK